MPVRELRPHRVPRARSGRRFAAAAAFALVLAAASAGAAERFDTDLTVTLDPRRHRLEATAELILSDMAANEPVLELAATLEVRAVEIDGTPASFRTTPHDGALQLITVEHPGALEGAHAFRVVYHGEIHDPPAVAADARSEVADRTSGTIQEEGVFLLPDSGWYPRVAGSEAYATFRLAVGVPPGWDAVAEGELVAHEPAAGGGTLAVYASTVSHEGLHLVAGPWERVERRHGEIVVAGYLYPADVGLADSYLPAIARYLDLYAEWFGPYPYGRFAVVENFFATGYGMPGFTVLGENVMQLPFLVDTSLGHEVAHGWWGNGVRVDDRWGDWSEGLTTYVADHHYEARKSAAAAAEYRRELCREYASYVSSTARDEPLAELTERSTSASRAIGYGKAMMVFHMLRERIGGKHFDRALREMYGRRLHRPVSWDEWSGVFREVAGEDLGWFFRQWVLRSGAPRLRLEDVEVVESRRMPDPRPGDEGARRIEVVGAIRQDEPPWRIRVPLTIEAGGETLRRSVELDSASARFRFELPTYPDALHLDPEQDVFRRLDPREMPPVLSRVLGDERALYVVDDRAGRDAVAAYRALAATLTRGGKGDVVDASVVDADRLRERSVFLLGLPAAGPLRALLDGLPAEVEVGASQGKGFALEGTAFSGPRASLLAVGRHPQDPARGVALFWGLSPGAIERAGAKLVYYGRASWVGFVDAEARQRGVARVADGPLVHRFRH